MTKCAENKECSKRANRIVKEKIKKGRNKMFKWESKCKEIAWLTLDRSIQFSKEFERINTQDSGHTLIIIFKIYLSLLKIDQISLMSMPTERDFHRMSVSKSISKNSGEKRKQWKIRDLLGLGGIASKLVKCERECLDVYLLQLINNCLEQNNISKHMYNSICIKLYIVSIV